MSQILLIADRKTTIDSLRENLADCGFRFLVARNHRSAIRLAKHHAPDLVIFDETSGRLCGTSLCQALHRVLDAPLIAIVRDGRQAREVGATFSLIKPYSSRQLADRVREALDYPYELSIGPLTLHLRTRQIYAPHMEAPVPLTPKLFALLRAFMKSPGEALSREALMGAVWQTDFVEDTRTLDVHVRWIRKIIEPDPSVPRYLHTVRGIGYCLDCICEVEA